MNPLENFDAKLSETNQNENGKLLNFLSFFMETLVNLVIFCEYSSQPLLEPLVK